MKARLWIAVAAGCLAAASPAAAQGVDITHEANFTIVAGAYDQDAGFLEAEGAAFRAAYFGEAAYTLTNGADIGVGIGLGAKQDHPNRRPRGGIAGRCAALDPGCPSFVRGPISGFQTGGVLAGDDGLRGVIDSAFVFARGGWGEASLGLDTGAADRFSLRPPSLFRAAGGLNPRLDPSGFGGVQLANDLSGQSAKAVYASPRLLGVQIGASYAPEADYEGLDTGFVPARAGVADLRPRQVWEGGLSFSRTLAGGLEANAALTYAQAEAGDGSSAVFDDIQAWGAGALLAKDTWRIGASYLASDNGARTGADYSAYGASWVMDFGQWSIMAEAGYLQDKAPQVELSTVIGAIARRIGQNATLAGGMSFRSRNAPAPQLPSSSVREDSVGFVAEMSVGF